MNHRGDAQHSDRRTNVLLLRDVPEQRLYSMERLADEIERGFAGHESIVMTSTMLHESALAARLGLRRLDSYATRFARYPLAARSKRVGIYHILDHGYGHLAALLPHERTVISCHDLMQLKAAEGVAGFTPRRVSLARFRWSTSWLRRVAHVICPSDATKRDLIALRGVDPDRISVVPYGVDARFRVMPDGARNHVKLAVPGAARQTILHVSTGDAYKNVAGTLRVLAALRQSGVDVALVRVGVPLDAAERDLALRLNVAGAVIECGRVSDQRLVELYNACDVLLFPSFYEGYGWPPLEAMACGLPVVTSDCQSLVEVVADAGLRAGAGDVPGLGAAVRAILESPELAARMRRRGVERAAQFTWARTIEGVARAYELVAESGGAKPGDGGNERRTVCAA